MMLAIAPDVSECQKFACLHGQAKKPLWVHTGQEHLKGAPNDSGHHFANASHISSMLDNRPWRVVLFDPAWVGHGESSNFEEDCTACDSIKRLVDVKQDALHLACDVVECLVIVSEQHAAISGVVALTACMHVGQHPICTTDVEVLRPVK